jgi:DNA (cytosine-5)-methyltransferase 1
LNEPFKVLDLFSGIGGFSLGLERTGGFKTVAFCEIEPYCRAVLKKHWPNVPQYDDVRTLTAERLRADGISVDVVCGGFPCQDISTAGLGAGIDGERSGLWREYHRIISELRPRFVIVENVAALLSRGMGRVLGGLAALGYDAEWHCIPASYVGLPHRRDRVWIVAYPSEIGHAGQIFSHHSSPCDEARKARTSLLPPYFDGMGHAPDSYSLRDRDGFPGFMGELNSYGNAVVPQIPEIIGRAILQAEWRVS